MAALAFCSSIFVRLVWLAIHQSEPTSILRVDELIEYFSNTWLNGSFPQSQQNYFNQHLPRTNNHVEGWHSQIKKIINKPHPNIYSWVEFIQREEAVTKAKIQTLRLGATSCPQRHCVKEKEKRIEVLFDCFNGGTLSLDDYLEAIKHLTGL